MTLKPGALKRMLLVGGLTLAAAGLTMQATPVSARTFVSVGVGVPFGYVAPPVVYAPPAYAPAPPVVYGPPVAYAAPGYYYGPPVYGGIGVTFGGHYYRHWR